MPELPLQWPRAWKASKSNSRLITVFGKLVVDEIHTLESSLTTGGHIRAEEVIKAGGAPANMTAQLAARDLPSRFAGWIGNDSNGKNFRLDARRHHIDVRVKSSGRTPKATVMVNPDGERTLLTNDGEGTLVPRDVRTDWFADSAVVHLDGYDLFSERFPEAVVRAAAVAHEDGILVTLDMGAANRIMEEGPQRYRDYIARIRPEIIFANAAESLALGMSVLRKRFEWNPMIVIHNGADPTTVTLNGQRRAFSVEPIEVVDTTGCGDAFAAGFLAGWVDGQSISASVRQAHQWAAETALVIGAQPEFDVLEQGQIASLERS